MPEANGPKSALWHERDMARVARRLHDRIGPALCAAGLQLSLIEQAFKPETGSEAAEAVAGLREALAESAEEVRTLNYVCDPALVRRLGLKTAVGYLARMVRVDPGEMGEVGGRRDAAAAEAFSILRQALLFWSESSADVELVLVWSLGGVKITASAPAPEEVAELAAGAGGRVSKDRMWMTVKLGRENGGSGR
jgi:hypothetical protein